MYELICRHGCFSIQINDQGREFVNGVSAELHRLTGTNQRVTSAYHPQANGLVERQNRTIKNSLIKVLDSNPTDWPYVIEGVLFAHRVSKHASIKYSPFELLYKAVLPIDIKHNTNDLSNLDEPFDKAMFDTVLESATSLRNNINHNVEANIKKAQKKQQHDYDLRHFKGNDIKFGDKVLLRDNKRIDRKGGKFTFKWLGLYEVTNLTDHGLASLKNQNGTVLKKKFNKLLLISLI